MVNLKQDYAVFAATNGEMALEMASKSPKPDVTLTDVTMPEMDGYETSRRLMQNLESRNIAVILVSANGGAEGRLLGYKAGGGDCLVKPVHHIDEQILANLGAGI